VPNPWADTELMIDVVKMKCRQDLVPNFMNRLVLASAASLPTFEKRA
jgi:hypothetical protein